jgi:hypothetical protein
MFEYQFNHFPKLGYSCIGLDYNGLGKSDRQLNCVGEGNQLKRIAFLE